jgi:uncharacterized protein (TIGR03435 family)
MMGQTSFGKKLLAGLVCVAAGTFVLATGAVPVFGAGAQAVPANVKNDIVDTWQGTLLAKAAGGKYTAQFYSIDQDGQRIPVDSVTLDGSTVKMSLNMIGGTYEGKLSANGNTIDGSWSQGGPSLPLMLARSTPETAWAIPTPPPPIAPMAADANPSFEVATIKPNNSGAPSLQALIIQGRNFITRNSSLEDLIAFAYKVQKKQIVNGSGWMKSERYDIDAIPDAPGTPNTDQINVMIQKLLADRFSMKFHHEKREMSAYVLTVGKPGTKLTPTAIKEPQIRLRVIKGGITLHVTNATIPVFTSFLQQLVLDQPVVDRTGLTDHYDFDCTFAPDDSQFGGHPPQFPSPTSGSGGTTAPATDASDAPTLFEAISQQLGLKLSGEKSDVDVIVIDHIDHPSPN